MAVLRLQDEADCLSSQRTENLRAHPPAGHRSKSPYRASGLVLRSFSDSDRAPHESFTARKAEISGPTMAASST